MNNLQSILAKLETTKQTILATLERKRPFVLLSGAIPDSHIFTDLQAVEWAIEQVKAQIENGSFTPGGDYGK
jgi:hypothetical protein